MPRPNRSLIYCGACLIAGVRLAREKQVNVRVVPTIAAIEESIDLFIRNIQSELSEGAGRLEAEDLKGSKSAADRALRCSAKRGGQTKK